jgi:hypothetical protein
MKDSYLRRERVTVAGGRAWIEFSEPTFGHYRKHLQPPDDEDKRAAFALTVSARLVSDAGGDWSALGVDFDALTPAGKGNWVEERLALIDALSFSDYIAANKVATDLQKVEPTETESRQSPPPSESSSPDLAADGATE